MARTLFGDCVLEPDSRVLRRSGLPVHLTPKAFDLLELLLQRRPRAVGKPELMMVLWPGVAVTEGSLANLVSEIRIAIGDTARPARYIRTVHRIGYSFCGEARTEDMGAAMALAPRARFRLVAPEGEVDLAEGENLIGRAEDCRLCIHSSTVSRHHARISIKGEEVSIEDLGSKNGTFVGGHRLEAPAWLFGGETIEVGSIRLRFAMFSPGSATDTYEIPSKIRRLSAADVAAHEQMLARALPVPGPEPAAPTASMPVLPSEPGGAARRGRAHRGKAGSASPSRPHRS
jgi:DNA-binding winged helix-turn-helix (wHTH) protein